MNPMYKFVLIVIGVALVLMVIRMLMDSLSSKAFQEEASLPYKKVKYLLTRAERKFMEYLEAAVSDRYAVIPKVRLADVIEVSERYRHWHLNKIAGKHLDFVLCDRKSYAIMAAVELDDSSHDREDRRKRDEFVDKAMQTAGVPLLRFKVQQEYSAEYIREAMRSKGL